MGELQEARRLVIVGDQVEDVGRLARRRDPHRLAFLVEAALAFGIGIIEYETTDTAVGADRDMILDRNFPPMYVIAADVGGGRLAVSAPERHGLGVGRGL